MGPLLSLRFPERCLCRLPYPPLYTLLLLTPEVSSQYPSSELAALATWGHRRPPSAGCVTALTTVLHDFLLADRPPTPTCTPLSAVTRALCLGRAQGWPVPAAGRADAGRAWAVLSIMGRLAAPCLREGSGAGLPESARRLLRGPLPCAAADKDAASSGRED